MFKKKVLIMVISIIIVFILGAIGIFRYKGIINTNMTYKINKEDYINLVSQTKIDIFLYDTSNILNNIQGKDEIDSSTLNDLKYIYYFYEELINKFKNINPPKEFKKNNEFLILSIENCTKNLEKILFNKEQLNLKEDAINFMKSNEELIKILEQINSNNI